MENTHITAKHQPKFGVSVIIPVYNAAKYIKRCVLSALNQNETLEIILIEDASPDDSLNICRQLEAEYPETVKLIQHPDKKNHGAGASRNLGAEHASSPHIAFLDADDYFLPDRFSNDYTIFSQHPDAHGVYNALGTDFEDDAGRQWYERSRFPLMTTMSEKTSPEMLFFKMNPIGTKGRFSFDALTIKRDAFMRTPRFSNLKIGEDTLLLVQMAFLLRLYPGKIRNPVAMRRVHAENRVQDLSALRTGMKQLFQTLETWIETVPATPRHKRALWFAHLSKTTTHQEVCTILRNHPSLLLNLKTFFILLRWTLCRRYPDDPLLPGLRQSRR